MTLVQFAAILMALNEAGADRAWLEATDAIAIPEGVEDSIRAAFSAGYTAALADSMKVIGKEIGL